MSLNGCALGVISSTQDNLVVNQKILLLEPDETGLGLPMTFRIINWNIDEDVSK